MGPISIPFTGAGEGSRPSPFVLGLLATAVTAVTAVPAAAQVCFEPATAIAAGLESGHMLAADLDGDGDADLAILDLLAPVVAVAMNLGNGTFAAQVTYPVSPFPWFVASADVDGDLDLDLVVTNTLGVAILQNQGGGTFAPPLQYGNAPTACLAPADLDGDGDVDLALAGGGTVQILLNQGGGSFATPVHYFVDLQTSSVVSADLDGDGDLDLAVAANGHPLYLFRVLLNQGNGAFAVGPATSYGGYPLWPLAASDLDGDGDVDIAGARLFGDGVGVLFNQGNATFAPLVELPAGASPSSVTILDVDGDGDADLAASSDDAEVHVLENLGGGAFGSSIAYPLGFHVFHLASADMDGDGDPDLAVGLPGPRTVVLLRNCRSAGAPYCAGDGSGTPCPCANHSPAGQAAGCLHSLGTGGILRGTGMARVANDTLVLRASSMSNSAALYFQGDLREANGAGALLGDGKLCVAGNLIRLGTVQNVGGAGQYPGPGGGVPVSVRGLVAPGDVRFYQTWFRNAASYCTPATYNLTNGLAIRWAP